MIKACKACDHPERSAIEEALGKGESYRELTRRFKVPVGAMRRHRKGHMDAAEEEGDASAPTEGVYLRFGDLPEDGYSLNRVTDGFEEGVSVYRGRKSSAGGYVLDIPRDLEAESVLSQAVMAVELMLETRPVYVAVGAEIGEGEDGEPLLENVALKPVSPLVRVDLPEWWGPTGLEFADGWHRWRRGGGKRTNLHHREPLPGSLVALADRLVREVWELVVGQPLGRTYSSDLEIQEAESTFLEHLELIKQFAL